MDGKVAGKLFGSCFACSSDGSRVAIGAIDDFKSDREGVEGSGKVRMYDFWKIFWRQPAMMEMVMEMAFRSQLMTGPQLHGRRKLRLERFCGIRSFWL